MDDLTGILEGHVRFIRVETDDDELLVIAISKFETFQVGCGKDRKEALFNLFANAFPGKRQELSTQASWSIGVLEEDPQ